MKKRILVTFTDATLYIVSFLFLFTLIMNGFFFILALFVPILAVVVRDYLKARRRYA